jgi:preprotein translocase subunit YajC
MSGVPYLAHVGHWYLWVPYMIPVVIVLGASFRAFRQQRREDRAHQHAGKPNP